ncbi:MAG: amidohydrolase family protein [Oceanipulchritudo sp.]
MKKQGSGGLVGKPEMMIWDAHVHGYPGEVISDPGEWGRRQGERHWRHLVTEGPQGWADPEDLLRAMDSGGVEKALLQSWYWENPESAQRQNEWHARWIERYPERFLACAAIHPEMQDPLRTLQEAREWGACAIGECLPGIQNRQGWSHPAWQAILEWTTASGWPACIHLTESVGHSYPGRIETCLMEIVSLFEAHPGQKWLCAHWGGGLPFYALNRRVAKALKHVWFDTAASPLLYDPRIWRIACDLMGPEKILFGSDIPLLLYPRKEKTPSWDRFLVEFRGSGLRADEQEAIGRNNLAALLGLSPGGS